MARHLVVSRPASRALSPSPNHYRGWSRGCGAPPGWGPPREADDHDAEFEDDLPRSASAPQLPPLGREGRLQLGLSRRRFGGPLEQTLPSAERLRGVRETQVIHSSIEEPLTPWKTLEPCRPRWPHQFRRFHGKTGFMVTDQDTVQVSARDMTRDTKLSTTNGRLRFSSCRVTYSYAHLQKIELDVKDLILLIRTSPLGGAYAWTLRSVEAHFRHTTGRTGVWRQYELPFVDFVSAFPRTFERFGEESELIRLRQPNSDIMLDKMEDVMVRLGKARGDGNFGKVVQSPKGPAFPSGEPCDASGHRIKTVLSPLRVA